jgi:hypothetical protein
MGCDQPPFELIEHSRSHRPVVSWAISPQWRLRKMPGDLSVDDALTLSVDELDILLGEQIAEETFNTNITTARERIRIAHLWFTDNLPALRSRLCDREIILTLLSPEHKDRNTILAAIADLLQGFSPIPTVLAVRILHYGYDQLCLRSPEL